MTNNIKKNWKLILGYIIAAVIGALLTLCVVYFVEKNKNANNVAAAEMVSLANGGSFFEFNGNRLLIPSGHSASIVIDETETLPSSSGRVTQTGHGVGVGVRSSSDNISSQLDGASPIVHLNGSSVDSGSFRYSSTLEKASSPSFIIGIIGAIMIAAAFVIGYMGVVGKKLAIGVGVGGFALVAIAVLMINYPWVFLLSFFVVAGVFIYVAIDSRKNSRVKETLKTIVHAVDRVDAADPVAARKVKDSVTEIAQHRDIVKEEVNAIKREI